MLTFDLLKFECKSNTNQTRDLIFEDRGSVVEDQWSVVEDRGSVVEDQWAVVEDQTQLHFSPHLSILK